MTDLITKLEQLIKESLTEAGGFYVEDEDYRIGGNLDNTGCEVFLGTHNSPPFIRLLRVKKDSIPLERKYAVTIDKILLRYGIPLPKIIRIFEKNKPHTVEEKQMTDLILKEENIVINGNTHYFRQLGVNHGPYLINVSGSSNIANGLDNRYFFKVSIYDVNNVKIKAEVSRVEYIKDRRDEIIVFNKIYNELIKVLIKALGNLNNIQYDHSNLSKEYATDKQAIRYNSGKLRFDWIPPEVEEALASILTASQGEGKKYPARNWEKGMSYMTCYASLRRHLNKWVQGIDVDEESGEPHLHHILWNVMALVTYDKRGIGEDDRIKIEEKAK